jgi:hypothetical protein
MNKNIKAGSDIHAGDGGYSEGTQEDYEKFAKARGQSFAKMRIREFERASGMDVYGLGAKRVMWESRLEKFAELIVGDCIEKIETYRIPVGNSSSGELACEWTYAALKEIRDEIKEHFGIDKD